jgi:hypothetical protein
LCLPNKPLNAPNNPKNIKSGGKMVEMLFSKAETLTEQALIRGLKILVSGVQVSVLAFKIQKRKADLSRVLRYPGDSLIPTVGSNSVLALAANVTT